MVTTIGNVNDHSPRPVGAIADASISLHGVEDPRISGARPPAAPTISVAEGLDAADRDLGLRLRTGARRTRRGGVLSCTAPEVWSGAGGSSTRHDVEGQLQPILVDGLYRPVVAAWTPAAGDQRWYVVPDVCDWHSILDWLAQRALPRYVPGALRRARSPLALDPALQTPAEAEARSALAELETSYTARRRELEERLAVATANSEPVRNGLLYGTSADLVDAVATVLRAAGLTVVDLDDLLGDTVSADLLVSLGARRRLIEVKSASGNASESLVGQLETHLRTWPQLWPHQPVDGGGLIINHQHRLEPAQRSDTVYGRPEFVAALALPVLPTRALFEWWRSSNWAAIRTAVLGDCQDDGQGDGELDNGPSPPRQPREPVPGPVRSSLLGRLGRRPRPGTPEGRAGRS